MAIDREALQAQSQQLRVDLKTWEKAFASKNNAKPSRDDVKNDPEIAAKYKEYSRIRDILSMKVGPPPMPESPPRTSPKRKHRLSANEGTPLKRRRHDNVATPRKDKHVGMPDQATPSSHASTPRQPSFIGPTPQKDGRVLGLFDLMDVEGTPSRARGLPLVDAGRPALVDTAGNRLPAPATPSKASRDARDSLSTPATATRRLTRTPQSSAKRYLLDKFATPSKRRLDDGDVRSDAQPFSGDIGTTPSFLRRDSQHHPTALATLPEESEVVNADVEDKQASPTKARFTLRRSHSRPSQKPARGPGGFRSFTRSLSALMADVKHAYESRYDDDEEVMREAEDIDAGPAAPQSHPHPQHLQSQSQPHNADHPRGSTASSATLVADTQPPTADAGDVDVRMLGPDGAHNASSSDDDNNNPARVYKKKGAKRQTRRVILKPAKKLPKPPSTSASGSASASAAASVPTATTTAAPKRRASSPPPLALPQDAAHSAPMDDQETGTVYPYPSSSPLPKKPRLSPDATNTSSPSSARLKSAWSATTGDTSATSTANADADAETARDASRASSSIDIVRQATKRVSASAHANFRKLKMRNKGGSGAGAGGKKMGWGRKFRR